MFLAGLGLPPNQACSFSNWFGRTLRTCNEAMRMGSQSSILELRTSSVSGLGPSPSHQLNNPQFWSSVGAYSEISQEKRNHAHDFDFPENLKIWSHGGARSLTHPLRTRETQSLSPHYWCGGKWPYHQIIWSYHNVLWAYHNMLSLYYNVTSSYYNIIRSYHRIIL